MIRKKLSLADPDEDNVTEKPWQQPRFVVLQKKETHHFNTINWKKIHFRVERSHSSSNQSLQICYINESCSSDENENSTGGDKTQTIDSKSSSTSPTASPYFTSPRGYGKGYMRQHRLSDASSPTSSLSSLSTTTNSESTIIHHHSHNGRACSIICFSLNGL